MARRAATFELGSVVADRRIDSVAGRGGMGVVYRAWNLRLKRVEAVKVIAEDLVRDSMFRERFERETEIAANIDHPHVVTLYDSGEGPDGQLFIAMQYVDGTTLERLIGQRGRLEPVLAAGLISQVASALDAAHGQGLVHRDVKPANVLIAGREGGYHAYLTDFGLAKRVASKTVLTGVGLMVGTVDYMAPEQAHGRPVDLHADVYALGATLFKALTGEVPYPREGEIARLFAKLAEPPPMVSQVADVPPAFDVVVARAMAEGPTERYGSAGELGRAALAAARTPTHPGARTLIGPGTMLGDCLLEEVAGEGGMAVIYRATQVKLGRTVAVKVMSKELAEDPAFRARFEREWRIAASIDHPNVVPIYWAGEAQGVLYIVMRFIGGGSLKEALLVHGRLEPERAVEVIEQIASALDAAHARGLVHRDIKPGNVLIDDESGRVFLTDFGLAKSVDDTDITDAREILGTARYMAPERGSGTSFDEARSDVYSLGCVLWDLLSGAERLKVTSVAGVSSGLAAVVLRAIDSDPAARHASAGELARGARASLAGVVGGAPDAGSAAELPPTTPPVRLERRRREPFAPEPLSSGLCERVLALCDGVLAVIDDEAVREPVLAVRSELAAPLRLALVGSPEGPGAERARLLGALLGRRVAAAPSAERIGVDGLDAPVSFAFGMPERIEAELADGTRREHALAPDGSLPAEMAATSGQVREFRVWLPIDALKTVSFIYPPGGALVREAADAFLVSVPRTGEGNPDAVRAVVLDALAGGRCSAVNSSCALATPDPAFDAPGAAAVKRALGPLVAGVVPFSGMLALAANTGVLSEQIVDDLAHIAGDDAGARSDLLASETSLLAAAGSLSSESRHQLLELIGLPGIRAATELADAGELTTIGLTRRLRELSGIEGVHREIDGLYQRADALKAARGLAALEQLSYRWPELASLRDQVESTRFEPRMHVLGLVAALERSVADDIDLPADLRAGLERLVTAPTPQARLGIDEPYNDGDLARAALTAFRSWKMFENGSQASPRARRIAQVVARSLRLMARDGDPAVAGAGSEIRG